MPLRLHSNHLARRPVLRQAATALLSTALLAALVLPAAAQEAYPVRPIRLVIPYPPGGGNDTLGRIVAQRLSASLGQQVFVDNKPGASGNLGTEQVARAKPDGYTLTLGFVANMSITPHMGKVNYDPQKDFAPISMVAQGYQILVVNPSFPARTVPELVAMAKAGPGTLNFASGGNGSPLQLAAELFKIAAGIDMMHIPYKGSTPAAAAVLSGETQMVFGGVVSSLPFVKSGKLRALAVTSPRRIDAAPDVPTMTELGYPAVVASSWYGLFAPAGTPPAIIARLNREMVALGKNPEHRAQLDKQGQEAVYSTPQELRNYVKSESDKWGRVVKTAKIEAE
jgi:tripartite-type tricarboxylate transporter receptor subunit TctC